MPNKTRKYCNAQDDGGRAIYTLRDLHGNSQTVIVCMKHAEQMPLIDGDRVTAEPAESGCVCDFALPLSLTY